MVPDSGSHRGRIRPRYMMYTLFARFGRFGDGCTAAEAKPDRYTDFPQSRNTYHYYRKTRVYRVFKAPRHIPSYIRALSLSIPCRYRVHSPTAPQRRLDHRYRSPRFERRRFRRPRGFSLPPPSPVPPPHQKCHYFWVRRRAEVVEHHPRFLRWRHDRKPA